MKRTKEGIWGGLEGGKRREKFCNYTTTQKLKKEIESLIKGSDMRGFGGKKGKREKM